MNENFINNLLAKIFPEKNVVGDKTLVITRNLAYMLTMESMLPYIENYLNRQGIDYVFEFTVSKEAVNSDPELFDVLNEHERINMAVFPKKQQRLGALDYKLIKKLDLDVHKAVTPEMITANSNSNPWATNDRNQYLLNFIASSLEGNLPYSLR